MIEQYASCELLIPCAGADDGVVFTDLSRRGRTVTPYGGAVTKTRPGGYGSAAYLGGGRYLRVSGDDDFALGPTGTVAATVEFTNLGQNATVMYYGIYGQNEPWSVSWNASQTRLISTQSGGTAFASDALPGLTLGEHHVELVGDGSVYRWFLDGVQVGYRNTGVSFPSAVSDLWIGATSWDGASQPIYVRDVAIWKGVAVHAAAFTPPDRLCGYLSNSGAGVPPIRDHLGAPAARSVSALPLGVTDPRVFQTTSGSDGRYSLMVPMLDHDVIIHDSTGTRADILVSRVLPA